jgi:hypothetical protein
MNPNPDVRDGEHLGSTGLGLLCGFLVLLVLQHLLDLGINGRGALLGVRLLHIRRRPCAPPACLCSAGLHIGDDTHARYTRIIRMCRTGYAYRVSGGVVRSA